MGKSTEGYGRAVWSAREAKWDPVASRDKRSAQTREYVKIAGPNRTKYLVPRDFMKSRDASYSITCLGDNRDRDRPRSSYR